MRKRLFISHGGKGGVGKSLAALFLAECLQKHREPQQVFAIETDVKSPVFGRKARLLPGLRVETVDINDEDGWMTICGMIEKDGSRDFLVNFPPNLHSWSAQKSLVAGTMDLLEAEVTVLWTIDTSLDSVLQLEAEETPEGWRVVVVKNLFFGDESSFFEFDNLNRSRSIPFEVITMPRVDRALMGHISNRKGTFSTAHITLDTEGAPEYSQYEQQEASMILAAAEAQFNRVIALRCGHLTCPYPHAR